MSITLPTKSQVQQKQNQYVLSNSPLTDVRTSGNLNALTGSNAYALADFYRDLRVSMLQAAVEGGFNIFGFNALPGTQASATVQVTVTGATTIPAGFTVSTIGNSTNPAVLFQSTASTTASAAGTVNVPVQAVNIGSNGNVAASTITNVITAVPGVVAVTNPSPASGGTDPETLAEQQARFVQYIDSLPGAKASALAYAASQVSGVNLAAAYSPQYLTGYQDASGTYQDYSASLNTPKGNPFAPFVATPAVNDAFYIGANGTFTGFYIDVAVAGSGITAVWEYYGASGWTTLTTTSDLTNYGIQSGSVSFSVPSDWVATSVNGTTAYYVRLRLTSATVTTIPTWYSAFTMDPPPGYVFVYVDANPAGTNVLQNVQTACDAIRAGGDTVVINNATTVPQNITMYVVPTAIGAAQDLQTMITNALNALFNSLSIGQGLPISQITYAVTSLGAGTYVAEVTVSTPSANGVTVAPSQLLTAGAFTINIGAPSS